MVDPNQYPRTIPFGVRVRLNTHNVNEEAHGLEGTTLDPLEVGDEMLEITIRANPHFNVIQLDRGGRPILMLDWSLDLVEGRADCILCGSKGYLVVLGTPAGFGATVCDECYARSRRDDDEMDHSYAGHRGEDFCRGL